MSEEMRNRFTYNLFKGNQYNRIINIIIVCLVILSIMMICSCVKDFIMYIKRVRYEKETNIGLTFFDDIEPDIVFYTVSLETIWDEY